MWVALPEEKLYVYPESCNGSSSIDVVGNGTGRLNLTNDAEQSVYACVLSTVSYDNTADEPSSPFPRTVIFTVKDSNLPTSSATASVSLRSVCDELRVFPDGRSLTFSTSYDEETDGPMALVNAGNWTVEDDDSTELSNGTISIGTNFDAMNDFLNVTGSNPNITTSYDSSTGVLTFSGRATLAEYKALIGSVQYYNVYKCLNVGRREVTFRFRDTCNRENLPATTWISILSLNDVPVFSLNGITTVTYIFTRNLPRTELPIAEMAEITDCDNVTLDNINITVSQAGDSVAKEEFLTFGSVANVSVSEAEIRDFSLSYRLTGGTTIGEFQSVLRKAAYKNEADVPFDNERVITISVSDARSTVSATVRLVMDQQPATPLLKWNSSYVAEYVEDDDGAAFLDTTEFDIVPGDTDFFRSAVLTITNPKMDLDRLSFPDISVLSGVAVAVVGQNTTTLRFTATMFSDILASDFEGWLRLVVFTSGDQAPDFARNISVVVTDSPLRRQSPTLYVTLRIQAVKDRPVISGSPLLSSVTLENYLPHSNNNPGYRVDDVINGSAVTDVDLTELVGIAVVNTSTATGLVGKWQYWKNGDWIDFDLVTDCKPLLLLPSQRFRFRPGENVLKASGTASLTYRAWDKSSDPDCVSGSFQLTADSPVSSETETFSVMVTYSNHAPTINSTLTAGFDPVDEDLPSAENDGNDVSDVVSEVASDVDDADNHLGTAVVWVQNTNGRWQYRAENGTWMNIPAGVNSTNALLIGPKARIRFDSDRHMFGRRSIRFKAWDGSKFSEGDFRDTTASDVFSGPFSVANATAVIDVLSINDAPVVDTSGVGRRVYTENGESVSVFEGLLSITDVDNTTLTSVTITLTRNNLTDGDCEGTAVSGSGSDDGTGSGSGMNNNACSGTTADSIESDCLKFTGDTSGFSTTFVYGTDILTVEIKATSTKTLSEFASLLNTMTFSNTADETTNVNRTISVTASDGQDTSEEATVTVEITLVNDNSPTLSVPSFTLAFTEGDVSRPLFTSNLVITDADCHEIFLIERARVQLKGYDDANLENLSSSAVSNEAAITQSWNRSTGILTITGSGTVSLYQTLLGSLVYYNLVSEPTAANRTASSWLSDGKFTSNIEMVTISVSLINDQRPVLLLDSVRNAISFSAIFYESNAIAISISVTGMVSLTDEDSSYTRPDCDVMTLVNPLDGGKERIYLDMGPVGSVTNVSTSHKITLSGGDSLNEIAQTLQRLRYVNSAEEPDPTTRIIKFELVDIFTSGEKVNVTAYSFVNISLVNDPPKLSLGATKVGYTEGDPPVVLAPSGIVTDVDNVSLSSADVYFRNASGASFEVGQDILSFNTNNTDVIGTYDITSGVVKLTGPASVADFQSVLRTISYEYATEKGNPVQGDHEILFVVNDGLVNSAVQQIVVDFSSVNNRPVLHLGGSFDKRNVDVKFTEEGGAVRLVPDEVYLNDPDNSSLSYITVSMTNPRDGDLEYLTATVFGGMTVVGSSSSSVRLGGPATTGDFINVLKTMMYNNKADEPTPGSRIVEFVVSDGNRLSEVVTATIEITFVNDRPELDLNGQANGTGVSATFTENGPPVHLATPDVSVKDDDNDTMTKVRVILSGLLDGANEIVSYGTTSLTVTESVENSTYTYTFIPAATLPDVEAFIANLTYTNNAVEPTLGDRQAQISVYDGKAWSNTARATVTIVAVNDQAPTFDQSVYRASVTEELPNESVVTVVATDGDSHNMEVVIMYIIVSSNCSDDFVISATTGEVRTSASPPDREQLTYCSLNVSASDGQRTGETTVIIGIVDANDNSPVFVEFPVTVAVNETDPVGTEIFTVVAQDADAGGNAVIVYTLLRPLHIPFAVGRENGSVIISRPLDFEGQQNYNVTVLASDSGNPSQSSSVTVLVRVLNENEHPPVFDPAIYSKTLCESPDTNRTVATVTATDMDAGRPGLITYKLDHSVFAVHSVSGRVYNTVPLDFEAETSYEFEVVAEDGFRMTDTAKVTVYVHNENEHAPKFVPGSDVVYVPENAVVGALIRICTATDNDTCVYDQCDDGTSIDCDDKCMTEGTGSGVGSGSGSGCQSASDNTLVYSIVASPGSPFDVDSRNGSVTVKMALDRETVSRYSVTVQVTDGLYITRKTLNITVTDINDNSPEFDEGSYSANVTENVPMDTYVISVPATDADIGANGRLTYRLAGTFSSHFNISPSGEVTVAANIDRESVGSYSLEIVAEDGGTPARVTRVPLNITVVDLNDNTPKFDQTEYVAQIDEDYGSDTDTSGMMPRDVITVSAVDPDIGNGGMVQYVIISGDTSTFSIDMTSGMISALRFLNREEVASYRLVVEARDSGPGVRSSAVNVTVTLLDLNDNSPQFLVATTTREVRENSTVGTLLFNELPIRDPDVGDNGRVSFVKGADFPDDFELNSTTGAISIARELDRETTDRYQFYVTAIDQASNVSLRLSSTVLLRIVVLEVNDETPIITPNASTVSLNESVPVGTLVDTFTITDSDLGINGEFDAIIRPSWSPFNVSLRESGVADVRVSSLLDYEKFPSHGIELVVTDRGVPTLSASATITVTLVNENDEPPSVVNENTADIFYLEGFSHVDLEPDMNITDPDGFIITKLYNSTVTIVDGEKFTVGPEPFDCPKGIADKFTKIEGCGFAGASVITDAADLTLQEGGRLDGYTLILDGVNDFADYDRDIGEIVDGITIALWGRMDRLPANDSESVILSKRHPVNSQHYYTVSVLPDGKLRIRTTSSSGSQTSDFDGVGQKCLGSYCMLAVLIRMYNTTHWTVEVFVDGEPCGQAFVDPVLDDLGHTYVGATPDDFGSLRYFFGGRIHLLFVQRSALGRREYLKCIAGCGEAVRTNVDALPVGVSAAYNYDTCTLSISGLATVMEYVVVLNSLTYVSDVDEPLAGTRTVEVRVSDGAFVTRNPGVVVIMLSLTNDNPPILRLNGPLNANYSTVFVEDDTVGGAVLITNASSLTLTDGDRGFFLYDVTVTILNAPDGSNEILSVGYGQNHTFYPSTNELTFSANAEVSTLENTLRTVTYDNIAEEPDPSLRIISFHIRDGPRQESTTVYSLVSIAFVNDRPVLLLYSMVNYDEGDGPKAVNTNLSVSDNDNTTLTRATAWIVSAVDLADERLDANTTGTNIQKSYNVTTGTLTLWGEESVATYERVLRYLTYEHLDLNDPTSGPRMVKTKVFDGLVYSNEVEAIVTFSAVNDAPIVDLSGPSSPGFDYSSARFAEGSQPVVIVSSDAVLIDVDNSDLSYLEAKLTSLPDGSKEKLSVNIAGSVPLQQVYNETIGSLTVTPSGGVASVEDYQSVLRTLMYQNQADELTNDNRNVTVIASDGQLTSPVATSFISLVSSDDKPVITIPSNTSSTYVDSSGPVNILPASSVVITDADVNSRIFSFHLILRGVENVTLERLNFIGNDFDVKEKMAGDWIDYNVTHTSGGLSVSAAAGFLEQVQYDSDIDEPDPDVRRLVEVSVHDGALESDFVTVTIFVQLINDHSPIFTRPDGYQSLITENVAPRSVVTVVASDDDSGPAGELRYSLHSCQCVYRGNMRRSCTGNPFSVDGLTGMVNTTRSLDREETSVCYLVVRASDLGSPTRMRTVNVTVTVTDINDETPAFADTTKFAVDVPEDSLSGALAFNFAVIDGDDAGTDNGKVFYRIVGGTGSDLFSIKDENVGDVSVAGDLDVDALTAVNFYTVVVEARDRGTPSLAVNATFNITVTDVDDNCPYFVPNAYAASVSEDANKGTVVVNLMVVDADATNENREFNVTIAGGNTGDVFTVDWASLVIDGGLDREDISWYRVRVGVRDAGGICAYRFAWVNVTVLDVNDNRPCFERSSYRFTVEENVARNHSIGQLTASDADEGSNGQFMFSLWFQTSANFNIDPSNGVISTTGSLDREKNECFTFYAVAVDEGVPSLSCNSTVTVCLNDTNDNSPVFGREYSFNVLESNENVSLGNVSAVDGDATANFHTVRYSLTGLDSTKFAVDPASGEVSVTRDIDFETQCVYNFTVVATDAGGLWGTTRIVVRVLDENEYAPQFVNKNSTVYLLESADRGVLVFQVSAVDNDGGCDSPVAADDDIMYSLIKNPENVFNVTAGSGSVYLNVEVDYELRQSYMITARAVDGGGLYTLCNITVAILNVNDVAPVFVNDSYSATIHENAVMGTELFVVSAVDGDSPPHDVVWYILEGDDASDFAVDRSTGVVTVNKSIDFEETGPLISFFVVARDGVHDIRVPVTVNVIDLNDESPIIDVNPIAVTVCDRATLVADDLTVSDPDTDYDDIVNSTVTLAVPQCVSDLVRNTSYGTPTITSQYGQCGAAGGVDLTYEMLDFKGLKFPGYGYSFTGDFYGRVPGDKIPSKLANNMIVSVCFGLYKGGSGTLVGRNAVSESLLYRVVIEAMAVSFEYASTQGNTREKVEIDLLNPVDDNMLRTLSLNIYYPLVTAYLDGSQVGTVAMPSPMQSVDSGPVYVGKMPSDKLAFKGYMKSAIVRRGFANFLPPYSTGMGNLSATEDGFMFDQSRFQHAEVPDDLIPHGIGSAFSVYVRVNVTKDDEGFLFAKADRETGLNRPYALLYDSGDKKLEFTFKVAGSSDRKQVTLFPDNSLDDGRWHTVVLVVNGTIATFYIDGVPTVKDLGGVIDDTDTSHTFFIGSRPAASSEGDYFDGEMSHLVVRAAITSVAEFNCFLSGCGGTNCISDCSRKDSPCLAESERCVYDTKKYTQCGLTGFVDLLTVADVPRAAAGHLCLNGLDQVYVANLTAYGVKPALVNECTISVWMRLATGSSGYVLSQYDPSNVVKFAIYVESSQVRVDLPTGRVTLVSDTPLDNDIWHHITVIISQTDVSLVRDGGLVDSQPLPTSTETFNTDYPFRVGAALTASGDDTDFLTGRLRGLIASVKAEELFLIQCVSDCREYLRYRKAVFTDLIAGDVAAEKVSNLDDETLTSGVVTTTGRLTFTGVGSTGNYTSALRRLEYVNLFQATGTERRTVSYMASDGVQSSDVAVSNVSFSPSNTVPSTLDLNSEETGLDHVAVFTENAKFVQLVSDNPVVTDMDVGDERMTMIEIRLEVSYEDVGTEAIQYRSTDSDPVISVTAVECTTSYLVLYGWSSHEDYEAALKRVIYVNMALEPDTTPRRVSFVVHDYPFVSSPVFTTVVISPENDNVPEIYLDLPARNFSTSYVEDSHGVPIVSANVSIRDEDSGQMVLSNITVSIVDAIAQDLLEWSAMAPAPLSFRNVSDGEVVVQGPGSLTTFEAALRLLRYRSAADEPASQTRRIRFLAFDGRHYSAAVYTFVAIVFRDDHSPILYLGGGGNVNNTISFREGGNAFKIAAGDVRITDDDAMPTQITRVVVSVTNQTQNDELSNISAVPSSLRIRRIDGGSIEFTGLGSFEDYETAVGVVAYRDAGAEPERLSVTIRVRLWCQVDGVTSLCATSYCFISITPVDDHQPMFSQSVYYGNVSEDALSGTEVVLVVIVDRDRFSDSNPELSLTDDFGGRFRIGQSGLLEVGDTSLNRELQSSYTVEVTLFEAAGSGLDDGPSTMSSAEVQVRVLDVNDNPSVFVQESFSAAVVENATIGQVVLQLLATDNDTAANSRMLFSIAPDRPELPFAVNVNSGVLTVRSALDYEVQRKYDFVVMVRDPDISEFQDTANVTVNVVDVNDNAVELRQVPVSVVLREPEVSVLVSPDAVLFDADTVPGLDRLDVEIISPRISTESINVSIPVGSSVGAKYSDGARKLCLSGRASVSHYQTILRSVRYVDNAMNLRDNNRTVSLQALDSMSSQSPFPAVAVRIGVFILNNDPPSIDLDTRDRDAMTFSGLHPDDFDFPDGFDFDQENSYFTKFTEDGKAVRLSHETLEISDPDASASVHRAVVNLTNPLDGVDEWLSVETESGITMATESTRHLLLLDGPASHMDFERVLYTVRYQNMAIQPSGKFRVISFVVNDGRHDSPPAYAYVELTNVNDVPELRIGDGGDVDYSVTYVEGKPPISITSQDLSISDLDDTMLESATVSLAESYDEDAEILSANVGSSGLTLSRSNSYLFSLQGTAPLGVYATVLKTLTYRNSIRYGRAPMIFCVV